MIKDSKKEDNIVAIATDINQEAENTQENKTIAEAPALAAESKHRTIKEWKERCKLIEMVLEQSRVVLKNATEVIKKQNRIIEGYLCAIDSLAKCNEVKNV